MATLNGDSKTDINDVPNSLKGRFVTLPAYFDNFAEKTGSAPKFFMAAFDNLGIRYFWINTDGTFTNAPTPSGSYVTSSLVIEGRV